MSRPSWDEYFMKIAEAVGERSTCDRGKVGAIIVVGKRIVATGYAGSPPGMPHCDDVGHLMMTACLADGKQSNHCVRTIHAEENAILQAAKYGVSVEGGVVYCKMTPCFNCAKRIVATGIIRVVAKKRHHADEMSIDLFLRAGIKFEVLEDRIEDYPNQ